MGCGRRDRTAARSCEQVETLRQIIHAKNQDFFNYWRPENDTYIFGYRQHEQGRNAVEIPRFEPLAAAKDAQIARTARAAAGALHAFHREVNADR